MSFLARLPCESSEKHHVCRFRQNLFVDYGEVDFTGLRIAVHSVPMFHGMGTTQVAWVVGRHYGTIYTATTDSLYHANQGGVGTTMTCYKPSSPPRACPPSEMLQEAHALKSDYIFCTPNFPEVRFVTVYCSCADSSLNSFVTRLGQRVGKTSRC